MKKVIFTVSKNSDVREWESYHISKGFEIYLANNGNVVYDECDKFHIINPIYSQELLGHTNQQEYLMNMFYSIYKKEALIYFIDDDEYIVENESLKGNTYLNWKIYNNEYYPNTSLNKYFKPVVKTNQNISLKIHNIVNENDSELIVYDGNGNRVDPNIQFIRETSFKNYIIHKQYTSIKEFNNRILMRPQYERKKYMKIRIEGFYECTNIKEFHMCIILDNYDKIDILRMIYPRITFFISSPVIPSGSDIISIPRELYNCPELYIFRYAEENSLDIIIKRASKINTDIIDIEDEYKEYNLEKVIKHYQILQPLKDILSNNSSESINKSYKEYGSFNYINVLRMNKLVKNLNRDGEFESKSFKILFTCFK